MSSTPNATNTPASLDALRASYENWRKTVEAELKGVPFEKKLITKTPEGIALQPLYTRLDLPAATLAGQRIARAKGYSESTWDFAQEIALGNAADFNAALLSDLHRGQNAVAITLDCPTRFGKDADTVPATCTNKIGCCGLSINDLTDLAEALNKVELTAVPVHIRTGIDALPMAALLAALCKKRGTATSKLTGSVTADPLSEYAARGSLPVELNTLQDNLATWTTWAAKNAPALATIGIDASIWLNAGGNAVEDLAYAIAALVEYTRELTKRGLTAEQVLAHTRVTFAIGQQFFMETAKFRAFRLLAARVAAAYGLKPDASAKIKIHARTGRWNKTKLDINVNMLRVTTEALSAVLGGVDSLHIAPFDEVMGAPDEISRRISRNIHTIISEEFHLLAPNDPSGGSFYLEKLTDELARKAWATFQDIEKQGGYTAALRAGTIQTAVATVAKDKADGLDKRRIGMVGTNLFPNLKEKTATARPTTPPDFAATRAKAIKTRRPATMAIKLAIANKVVSALSTNADDNVNALVQAATQGATIGQLSAAIHPNAKPEAAITAIASTRGSEGYEDLRSASESYSKKNGSRPKIFVAKMGPVIQHKARADFTAGFFTAGGFELIAKEAYETADTAAKAAIASGAPVAVLASTDETYPELVPAFVKAVKAGKPTMKVILAGLPADEATVAAYKAAGIDDFISIRSNVRGMLSSIQKSIGAI